MLSPSWIQCILMMHALILRVKGLCGNFKGRYFNIELRGTGKYLHGNTNGELGLRDGKEGEGAIFHFDQLPDGSYFVTTKLYKGNILKPKQSGLTFGLKFGECGDTADSAIEIAGVGDRYCSIKFVHNGLALMGNPSGDPQVYQATLSTVSAPQMWLITGVTNDCNSLTEGNRYYVWNLGSKKFLGFSGSGNDGELLSNVAIASTPDPLIRPKIMANKISLIFEGVNKAVDLRSGIMTENAPYQIWTPIDGFNQIFEYRCWVTFILLESERSGLCLSTSASGVDQTTCMPDGATNITYNHQKWIFYPIGIVGRYFHRQWLPVTWNHLFESEQQEITDIAFKKFGHGKCHNQGLTGGCSNLDPDIYYRIQQLSSGKTLAVDGSGGVTLTTDEPFSTNRHFHFKSNSDGSHNILLRGTFNKALHVIPDLQAAGSEVKIETCDQDSANKIFIEDNPSGSCRIRFSHNGKYLEGNPAEIIQLYQQTISNSISQSWSFLPVSDGCLDLNSTSLYKLINIERAENMDYDGPSNDDLIITTPHYSSMHNQFIQLPTKTDDLYRGLVFPEIGIQGVTLQSGSSAEGQQMIVFGFAPGSWNHRTGIINYGTICSLTTQYAKCIASISTNLGSSVRQYSCTRELSQLWIFAPVVTDEKTCELISTPPPTETTPVASSCGDFLPRTGYKITGTFIATVPDVESIDDCLRECLKNSGCGMVEYSESSNDCSLAAKGSEIGPNGWSMSGDLYVLE